jgi:hypothetical protein
VCDLAHDVAAVLGGPASGEMVEGVGADLLHPSQDVRDAADADPLHPCQVEVVGCLNC